MRKKCGQRVEIEAERQIPGLVGKVDKVIISKPGILP
jgi:hypothetical protein